MFESNELCVKPVRRYRKPRYPSHTDPDPTLHPTQVPYPANSKLLAAVAAMGIATSTSCSEPAANSPAPANGPVATPAAVNFSPDDNPFEAPTGGSPFEATADDIEQAAAINLDGIKPPAENPFQVALSGLPHRPSSYGTGRASYLSEDRALQVIEKVFQQAGYRLTARHPYQKGDVALVADRFDVDKKIGFVVSDNGDLEGDWWNPQIAAGDTEAAINDLLQRLTANHRQMYQAAVNGKPSTESLLVADIQAAKSLPDPARREAAYRAILAHAGRDKISLAEMQQLERPRENGQDFIAVVSHYDLRFALNDSIDYTSELTQKYESLGKTQTLERFGTKPRVITGEEILRKRERGAVEALERAVREYIVWARSQGAQ